MEQSIRFGVAVRGRENNRQGYPIMGSPSEYRDRAADCVRAAQATESPGSNALYLTMAEIWVRLADQAEGLRRHPDPGKAHAKIRRHLQPLQSSSGRTTH